MSIASCILLPTHMLCVSQIYQGVSRCVNDGSCPSSRLSKSQPRVLMGYLTISTNVRSYQTYHRWHFSFRKTAHKCIVRVTQSSWVKNVCFPVFPDSAEAQDNWGGIVKRLLIAYFIGNICAKKYQNPFMCDKVIASQRWGVFETRFSSCSTCCFRNPVQYFTSNIFHVFTWRGGATG